MIHRVDRTPPGPIVLAIALGLLLAIAALASACKGVVVQTIEPIPPPTVGQIGDPCTPTGERHAGWPGATGVSSVAVEDGFDSCNSGICIMNHFQGRVSCPLGQATPPSCAGPDDTSCGAGSSCVAIENHHGPYCDPTVADGGAPQCGSGLCNPNRNTCACTKDSECTGASVCDVVAHECTLYVCLKAGGCQSAEATDAENAGKICCAEGTNDPVSEGVCGQCSARPAEQTVYCSCRCGPADDAPPDGSDYCACPVGFECSAVLPSLTLPVEPLVGKYCIKAGTAYQYPSAPTYPPLNQCGTVSGNLASYCDGTPAN